MTTDEFVLDLFTLMNKLLAVCDNMYAAYEYRTLDRDMDLYRDEILDIQWQYNNRYTDWYDEKPRLEIEDE